jgi:hypothetical protein
MIVVFGTYCKLVLQTLINWASVKRWKWNKIINTSNKLAPAYVKKNDVICSVTIVVIYVNVKRRQCAELYKSAIISYYKEILFELYFTLKLYSFWIKCFIFRWQINSFKLYYWQMFESTLSQHCDQFQNVENKLCKEIHYSCVTIYIFLIML